VDHVQTILDGLYCKSDSQVKTMNPGMEQLYTNWSTRFFAQ